MHLIVTTVAAACLGVHALLGCCWHDVWHSNACLAAMANADSHRDECGDLACCHGALHQEHQHPPGPCKCECRRTCNYLSTAKVECQHPDATGYVVFLPTADACREFTQPTAINDLARLAPNAALPLRLHLWNQILLI